MDQSHLVTESGSNSKDFESKISRKWVKVKCIKVGCIIPMIIVSKDLGASILDQGDSIGFETK